MNGVFSVKDVAAKLDMNWASPSLIPTIRVKHIPQKVNIFLWRAHRDLLPCFLNLALRGVNVSFIFCPLCLADTKSSKCALLRCPKAFMVWDSVVNGVALQAGSLGCLLLNVHETLIKPFPV